MSRARVQRQDERKAAQPNEAPTKLACQNVSLNVSLEVSQNGWSARTLRESPDFPVIGEESHPLRHWIFPSSQLLPANNSVVGPLARLVSFRAHAQ